jgi:TolA-binding protein
MPDLRLVAGILGTLIGVAEARVPRYTRPEIQVAVSLSDRVKPRPPVTPATAKPVVTMDAVLTASWFTAPVRNEQEQILLGLIQSTPDTQVDEKADYLFRLSEIYAQQQRYWRIKSVELYTMVDRAEPAARAKLSADASIAGNKAKEYLLKAVRIYKALTDNLAFRGYPKIDVALFSYGYTLYSGKYMKEARTVYDSLLKNYPNSAFVPEAHLVFGEYYFEHGQLADAEARYKHVLKFPKSSVYHYALYKVGWIHLQLQRYQDALETFFQVAMGTRNQHDTLARAARLDFVRAYAEIGKADKAAAAFQRVDAAAANEMLEALAQIYLETGKVDRAAAIHAELMKGGPKSARACDWQYRVAHGSLSAPGLANTDKIKAIEDLVKLHGVLADARALPGPALQECRANAIAMATELGRAYHSESLKTKNRETTGYAIRLYQAFLDGFPADAQRADIQSLQAEALWTLAATEPDDRQQRDLWTRTSAAFAELGKLDKTRAVAAGRASVLAWMNGHDDGTLTNGAVPQLSTARPAPARPLSIEHQQLVDAVASFAANARDPRDPEVGALRFLEANIYRRANQHDKAAALYVALIATHPNETFSEANAALAIDSLVLLQRLDEMLLLADKLAADPRYLADKPDLAAIVKTVRSRSMRR